MRVSIHTLSAVLLASRFASCEVIAEEQERTADEAEFLSLVAKVPANALHSALHAFNPARFRHGTYEADGAAAGAIWSDDPVLATSMVEAAAAASAVPEKAPARVLELAKRQGAEADNGTQQATPAPVSTILSTLTVSPTDKSVVVVTSTVISSATVQANPGGPAGGPATSADPSVATTAPPAAPPPGTTANTPTPVESSPVAPTSADPASADPAPAAASPTSASSAPASSAPASSAPAAPVTPSSSLVIETTTLPGATAPSTLTAVTVVSASQAPTSTTPQDASKASPSGSLQSKDAAAGLSSSPWTLAGGLAAALVFAGGL